MAAGGGDKIVCLWDLAEEKEPVILKGHTGAVQNMAFSHDGQWLASSSHNLYPNVKNSDERFQDGEIRLWNVREGKLERVLQPKVYTGIVHLEFSPDDKTLACTTTQLSEIRLLDVQTGQQLDRATMGPGWVYRVAFSPDGRNLAWSTSQQLVHLRDLRTKKMKTFRGHQRDIFGLAWSSDGETLATGSSDGRIMLWNAGTGKELLTLQQERSGIEKIWFVGDGKTLLISHPSKTFSWKLSPSPSDATLFAQTGYVALAVSKSGKLFAAADKEKRILLRNLETRAERFITLPKSVGISLAFAPTQDGKEPHILAIGTQEFDNQYKPLKPVGDCILWNTESNKEIGAIPGEGKPVHSVLFTSDGKGLFTGDGNGNLRLWNPETFQEIKHLGRQTGGPIYTLALSPDASILAAGGGAVFLWDMPGLQPRKTFTGHTAPVKGLAFVDNGASLLSTGPDRTLKVWNVAEGKFQHHFPVQSDQIHCLALSNDGQTIALGCQDRTIKLWDLRSRQLRGILGGHTREIHCLSFCPGGDCLLSGSTADSNWWVKGGEIKIWKAMK